MGSTRGALGLATLLWLLCVGTALALRPLLPVDETRYLTVAWEMWTRGGFLVPHLNGVPYSDKPPILFWAIHLLWALFGVSEWAARLVPPLFALGAAWLAAALAPLLWPDRPGVGGYAALVLVGTTAFTLIGSLVRFDAALTCFTLLGLIGMALAWRRQDARGFLLFGLAVGGGLLTKGPVILLHLLPVPLLAPWWQRAQRVRSWGWWYGGIGVGLVLGAAVALAWALPAARAGGEAYGRAILWGQTARRVVGSFAHAEPVWFYPALLPLALYPWIWWPPFWRALRRATKAEPDDGLRLCAVWMAAGLAGLSAVSGKQVPYLLPVLPAFALAAGRFLLAAERAPLAGVDVLLPALAPVVVGLVLLALPSLVAWSAGRGPGPAVPSWVTGVSPLTGVTLIVGSVALAIGTTSRLPTALAGVALGSALLFVVAHVEGAREAFARYDLRRPASLLAGREPGAVAVLGSYQGEFGFLARLSAPVAVLEPGEVAGWMGRHPDGRLVVRYRDRDIPKLAALTPELDQPYRSGRISVLRQP